VGYALTTAWNDGQGTAAAAAKPAEGGSLENAPAAHTSDGMRSLQVRRCWQHILSTGWNRSMAWMSMFLYTQHTAQRHWLVHGQCLDLIVPQAL
jgi:hypothetical protein